MSRGGKNPTTDLTRVESNQKVKYITIKVICSVQKVSREDHSAAARGCFWIELDAMASMLVY